MRELSDEQSDSPRASKWGHHEQGTNLPTYDARGRVVVKPAATGFRPDNIGPRLGKVAKPPEERFIKKYRVQKKTGCYIWLGKLNKWGKGTFYDGEKNVDPQRYSWFLHTQHEPAGLLQTTCSTPGCVNPFHLKEMNWRRHKRKQSVLSVPEVLRIRRLYDAGESVITIAKSFEDASEQSVGMAARRQSYKWIPEE